MGLLPIPLAAACGVLAMHLGLSQLSAATLHGRSTSLGQDQPRRIKTERHPALFCPNTALKIKQSMKNKQANHSPQDSLDTNPTLQKLNVVKWLEVTLSIVWFGIM